MPNQILGRVESVISFLAVALISDALHVMLRQLERSEIDESYSAAYRTHPVDEPDEWGDLTSWLDATAASQGLS